MKKQLLSYSLIGGGKSLVISLLCMLFTTNTFAYDFVVNGIYYTVTSEIDQEVKVVERPNGVKYTGDITIPDMIEATSSKWGHRNWFVTEIADKTFYNSQITNVTIPNSVRRIGQQAFEETNNLKTVTIEKGSVLEEIADYAFRYSSFETITSLTISDKLKSIGKYAFNNCTKLSSIILPASLTEIGEGAFCWCSNLRDIYYYAKLSLCQDDQFSDKTRFTGIHDDAVLYYRGSENLTSTTLWWVRLRNYFAQLNIQPATTISIGEDAFQGSRLEKITIPGNAKVSSIAVNAFTGCDKLTSLNIYCGRYHSEGNILFYNTDGNYGEYEFVCATPATHTVRIPSTHNGAPVTSIGDYAFNGYDIPVVEIPETVKKIGYRSFDFDYQSVLHIKSDNLESVGSAFDHQSKKMIFAKSNVIEQLKKVWGTDGTYVPTDASGSNNDEDVNNDGKVNATDVMQIYNYILSH